MLNVRMSESVGREVIWKRIAKELGELVEYRTTPVPGVTSTPESMASKIVHTFVVAFERPGRGILFFECFCGIAVPTSHLWLFPDVMTDFNVQGNKKSSMLIIW